jgi:hypothetical protein
LVERNLAKVEVASSSLVSRSRHSGKQSFPFCLVDRPAIEQICEPVVHATSCVGSAVRLRRDSKAVMQRPAKPFRPVRLRLAPPAVKEKPRLVGAFLLSALFPSKHNAKPHVGLIACVSIIVTDVLHNTWYVLHNPARMDLYLSQIAFPLFVAFTVRTAWKGVPRSKHARLGISGGEA